MGAPPSKYEEAPDRRAEGSQTNILVRESAQEAALRKC